MTVAGIAYQFGVLLTSLSYTYVTILFLTWGDTRTSLVYLLLMFKEVKIIAYGSVSFFFKSRASV